MVLMFCVTCAVVNGKPPANPVMLRIGEIQTLDVKPGDSAEVKVPITVVQGYHVNANPAASDDYIPIEVRLDSTGGITRKAAIYPKGKAWHLEGTTEKLIVYSGNVEVKIPLIVDRSMKPGKMIIKGAVDFQACDNHVCFMPDSLPIAVTVNVITGK